MSIAFAKMHGLGNDFVVVDARSRTLDMSSALVRALADRHRGVGFDQLAVIAPGDALTITFSTGEMQAVSRGTIPAIQRGRTGTIAVPMPTACFDPDCEFTIAWANQPEVEGFCQG